MKRKSMSILLNAADEMRTNTGFMKQAASQAIFYANPPWHRDITYVDTPFAVARENGARIAESLAYDNTDGPS